MTPVSPAVLETNITVSERATGADRKRLLHVKQNNPNPPDDRDLIHEILIHRNLYTGSAVSYRLLTCRLKSIPFCSKCQKRETDSDV